MANAWQTIADWRDRRRRLLPAPLTLGLVAVALVPAGVALAVRAMAASDPVAVLAAVLAAVAAVALLRARLLRWLRALLAQAAHDPLSGLPGRTRFVARAEVALRRAARSGASCAILFLDGDGFKAINDRLGHAAGDRVIAEVGARIGPVLRVGDMAARLGGDEFAVLIEHVDSVADVEAVMARIAGAMRAPVQLGAVARQVSLSAGCAIFPDDGPTVEALLRVADERMYAAKLGAAAAAEPRSPLRRSPPSRPRRRWARQAPPLS